MAKSPHSPEWRAMVSQEYIDGQGSSYDLEAKYSVNAKTIRRWAQRYKEHGILAFERGKGNSKYTSSFKMLCVELYISGKMSMDEIVAKYNISNWGVLNNWISSYNANRVLKDYDPKREVYMAEARRKTTLDERKAIVEYCINHNHDYKGTAANFDISYSQVFSWVKKYDANGEEALVDKRGCHKTDDEVDELERLRRENTRLKRQLEERDMVVELLKKVKEFEGM
jgi:Transposase and inactivated derivatives